MIIKKWFTILLALAFFAAPVAVFADDDDEYEYYDEDEEETPKKSSKKKAPAKKKADPEGPSRIGFYTGFGSGGPTIGFVYDMGTGLQLGIGVGLDRQSTTVGEADPVVNQTYSIEPIVTYALGKGLLNYGLSLRAIYRSVTYGEADPIADISAIPAFYTSAALVPNVVLSLNAGLRVDMLGDRFVQQGGQILTQTGMNISTATSVMIIFYFM